MTATDVNAKTVENSPTVEIPESGSDMSRRREKLFKFFQLYPHLYQKILAIVREKRNGDHFYMYFLAYLIIGGEFDIFHSIEHDFPTIY